MSKYEPYKVFFTKGIGSNRDELHSFEQALRNARIEKFNLVQVSSIFAPECKMISKAQGLKSLTPGAIVYCVMNRACTNEMNRLLVASIGCAISANKSFHGYISEYHAYGQSEKQAGDYAEDLAAAKLASILGINFNANESWEEKKEFFKINGKIVKTRNVTQSAVVKREGYTTVLAAAVFIMEKKKTSKKILNP